MKTLELTTHIGCKVNCKICPQKTLIERYFKISDVKDLSLEDLKIVLDKLPKDIRIDFSGMCEPFSNSFCTEMILEVAKRNFKFCLYSTFEGVEIENLSRLKGLNFDHICMHIPDTNQNSIIPVTNEYLNKLYYILTNFRRIGFDCHGTVDIRLKEVFQRTGYNYDIINRESPPRSNKAGHIKGMYDINNIGKLKCKSSGRQLNSSILLPNCDVYMCCMDYGLKYKFGNLLTDSYEDLFKSESYRNIIDCLDNNKECLCRHCSNSTLL